MIAVNEQSFVSVVYGGHAHVYIRKCGRISDSQVVKRSAADYRHGDAGPDIEAYAPVSQFSHYSGGSFKSERRASAKHYRVDGVDGILTSQKIRLSGSRSAASYVDAAYSPLFAYDDSAARTFFFIFRVAEPEPFYAGNVDDLHAHRPFPSIVNQH